MQSIIGEVSVCSEQPFIVYGGIRGLISEHRTQSGAERSAESDNRECHRSGSRIFSDVSVYQWSVSHGWIMLQEDWV